MKFGLKMLRVLPRLRKGKAESSPAPEDVLAEDIFKSCTFEDVWDDAQLPQCLQYLKGNFSLQIPEAWRRHLPREI